MQSHTSCVDTLVHCPSALSGSDFFHLLLHLLQSPLAQQSAAEQTVNAEFYHPQNHHTTTTLMMLKVKMLGCRASVLAGARVLIILREN